MVGVDMVGGGLINCMLTQDNNDTVIGERRIMIKSMRPAALRILVPNGIPTFMFDGKLSCTA
jgi:hypothetical protein